MFAKICQQLLCLLKKFAATRARVILDVEHGCRNQFRIFQRAQMTIPFVMDGFDHRNQSAPMKVVFASKDNAAFL